MEKITLENIGQEYPNLVNYELIKEKGFGEDKPNEGYFELLNRYIKLMDKSISWSEEVWNESNSRYY